MAPEIRLLVKFAITPLIHIDMLERSKCLPYDLLESLEPNLIVILRGRISTMYSKSRKKFGPLQHKFFEFNEDPNVNEHLKTYNEWNQLSQSIAKELRKEEEQGARNQEVEEGEETHMTQLLALFSEDDLESERDNEYESYEEEDETTRRAHLAA